MTDFDAVLCDECATRPVDGLMVWPDGHVMALCESCAYSVTVAALVAALAALTADPYGSVLTN